MFRRSAGTQPWRRAVRYKVADNTSKRTSPRGLPVFAGAASLSGLLALLCGCAVGPTFTTPQTTVPANWRATSDPKIATQTAADNLWWKAFNDAVLDRLIDLATHQNLPLQIAGLRIFEARAQLGVATGRQYPQTQTFNAGATAVGLTEQLANFFNVDRNLLNFQIGFDATWELDFWGKYRRGVQAETAGLLASVADYYSALVSLTAEVARTYVVIRTFEVLIAQAEQNAKLQEEALDIATSRFRNGATSELDPTQAAVLLGSTRATIPQLRVGLEQARNALSTLLGQPSGVADSLLTGPKEIPRAPAKVAIGVPAEMLRRRPDIRGAELLAASQCARIGVAKADLYPSFSLFGTFDLRAIGPTKSPRSPFSTSSIFYAAGPSINWAFLNYGRITNSVRIEDARFQQSLVSYRDTVLKAAQEVEDALAGFINSQQATVFEQAAVKAAERAVELSLVGYREGATDYQRVLDAQRSLLQEQNRLAQSTSSVATSVIALYKALGGGWESRQAQPVVPVETQQEMKQRTNWGDLLSQPRAAEAKQ